MKARRYFVAGAGEPFCADCACGARHTRLAEAFACAKRVGLTEVWAVELRGPIATPRGMSKVRKP